jgi:hypothetical protein
MGASPPGLYQETLSAWNRRAYAAPLLRQSLWMIASDIQHVVHSVESCGFSVQEFRGGKGTQRITVSIRSLDRDLQRFSRQAE